MLDKKPTRAEVKELNRSHFLWAILSQLNPDTKDIDFEKIKDDLHIVTMGATAKRWSRLKLEMAMEALKLQADSDEASKNSMAPKPSKSAKNTSRWLKRFMMPRIAMTTRTMSQRIRCRNMQVPWARALRLKNIQMMVMNESRREKWTRLNSSTWMVSLRKGITENL
jgi:hypothetical protein